MNSKHEKQDELGLLDQLRDAYIAYREMSNRCQVEFKPGTSSKLFALKLYAGTDDRKFKAYVPPKVPFLEDPEK